MPPPGLDYTAVCRIIIMHDDRMDDGVEVKQNLAYGQVRTTPRPGPVSASSQPPHAQQVDNTEDLYEMC